MSKLHYYEFQVNKKQLKCFSLSTFIALSLDLFYYLYMALFMVDEDGCDDWYYQLVDISKNVLHLPVVFLASSVIFIKNS